MCIDWRLPPRCCSKFESSRTYFDSWLAYKLYLNFFAIHVQAALNLFILETFQRHSSLPNLWSVQTFNSISNSFINICNFGARAAFQKFSLQSSTSAKSNFSQGPKGAGTTQEITFNLLSAHWNSPKMTAQICFRVSLNLTPCGSHSKLIRRSVLVLNTIWNFVHLNVVNNFIYTPVETPKLVGKGLFLCALFAPALTLTWCYWWCWGKCQSKERLLFTGKVGTLRGLIVTVSGRVSQGQKKNECTRLRFSAKGTALKYNKKKVHRLWTKWNKIVQLWLLGYGKTAQPKCWRRGGGTFSCNATPTTHSGSAHWKAEMQLNFVICFRVRKFIFLMKHDSSSGRTWPDVLLRGAFSPTSQRRRLGRWQCAWSPQGVGEGWPTERFEVTFRAEWADRTDCVCYSPEKFCVLHWQARDC